MSITFTQRGDWARTTRYLERMNRLQLAAILSRYGQMGVDALANATPVDSGLTSQSWSFEVISRRGFHSIRWHNTNQENGLPIAILLQYGHGTGTGGYVQGRDYINPAVRPIFDKIATEVQREVTT